MVKIELYFKTLIVSYFIIFVVIKVHQCEYIMLI